MRLSQRVNVNYVYAWCRRTGRRNQPQVGYRLPLNVYVECCVTSLAGRLPQSDRAVARDDSNAHGTTFCVHGDQSSLLPASATTYRLPGGDYCVDDHTHTLTRFRPQCTQT